MLLSTTLSREINDLKITFDAGQSSSNPLVRRSNLRHLHELLFRLFHSQTILSVSVLLAIPVQLLTIAAAIAERAASAAILAVPTFELRTTASTFVSQLAKHGASPKVMPSCQPSKVIWQDF